MIQNHLMIEKIKKAKKDSITALVVFIKGASDFQRILKKSNHESKVKMNNHNKC